ncbi:MAG: anti-sigma factor [Acidimicrobiales bacterium]
MNHHDVHQLAGAYALDALDPSEREAFETHLAGCDSCSTAVAEYSLTAAELGTVARRPPPAGLRAKVLADVATTRQVSPLVPMRRTTSTRVLAAAAALLLVAVGSVAALTLSRQGSSDVEVAAAPDAITLQLDPIDESSGDATIEVVWSPEQDRAVVRSAGLPDPGEGKVYELWFLLPDGVAAAGLFTPEDGDAEVMLELDDIDGRGWGVTIEPDGGSDQPTSPVLFAGEL